MTKQRRITRLTPATCEVIQTRMLEACRKVAADHGLVVESAGWHGMDAGFAFEPVFRVSNPQSPSINMDVLTVDAGPERAVGILTLLRAASTNAVSTDDMCEIVSQLSATEAAIRAVIKGDEST